MADRKVFEVELRSRLGKAEIVIYVLGAIMLLLAIVGLGVAIGLDACQHLTFQITITVCAGLIAFLAIFTYFITMDLSGIFNDKRYREINIPET